MRQVDKDRILISTVYRTAQMAAESVQNLEFESSKTFVDSLNIDDNGNLTFQIDGHVLNLNHNHRQGRRASPAGLLQDIKISLDDIKSRVIENITDNIQDQCDETTIYYLWSLLDLELKDDLNCRKEKMKELVKIFCSTKIHKVEEDWNEYSIEIEYTRLIDVDPDEMLSEFDKAWATSNGLWLNYYDEHKKGKDVQLLLLQQFLKNNVIVFPGLCKLVMVLIASTANTCAKRRALLTPEHLETLYLLGNLKIDSKSPFKYEKELQLLENN